MTDDQPWWHDFNYRCVKCGQSLTGESVQEGEQPETLEHRVTINLGIGFGLVGCGPVVRIEDNDRFPPLDYFYTRQLDSGVWIGVRKMLVTWALIVGIDAQGNYRSRYCYEQYHDAVEALQTWDGDGDPPGPWLKQKPGDRLGPGMVE